ncbi:tetratricopeptide repeat-containing diguanylate cyclase [Lachnobacterium bovis]|uniref:tetratricopeptide repeat-containing diguanylate cyclase n=1 Tax=Lachnobacterium bovis TaxID=140626 RepID=UPI00048D4EE7|nr:tetratricopeptide repeat-containing diguanylate cyclase [Lachnobacterium bovis]
MNTRDCNDEVKKIVDQILDNRRNDARLTLEYCDKLLKYARKNSNVVAYGLGYYFRSEIYYWLNDSEKFFNDSSKALTYLIEMNKNKLIAKSYNRMGIFTANGGNAPIAMDYYLNGLKYCDSIKLNEIKSIIEMNVGTLYFSVGKIEEAKKMINKALIFFENKEGYNDTVMLCIYSNLIKIYIKQEEFERARETIRLAVNNFWDGSENIDRISFLTIEAIYYHKIKDYKSRNACVKIITENLPNHMGIIDCFEDIDDYCNMLLETDLDDDLWAVINVVEPILKNVRMIYFQMRLMSIKIKYYRIHQKNAEFLKATGLYYEYSELMDEENNIMARYMLTIRMSLENEEKRRLQMELKNQLLQKKSEIDQLTQMPNRYGLVEYAKKAIKRARMYQKAIAIEILDVDFFKEYNDNYGHQQGDECLRLISKIIKEFVGKKNGFFARYGGDEFIIIYENVTLEQAILNERLLHEAIGRANIKHEYSKCDKKVTVSQGICCGIPSADNKLQDYLEIADKALYKVKEAGKNDYEGGILGEKVSI